MSTDDEAARQAHGVTDLFSHGRLTSVPRRPARRAQLLAYLAASLFTGGRVYTEQEVNEALASVHDDTSALRRYLVEEGFLGRTRDGAVYQRLR
ncbi:DUF2087 domain-containing protein [Actinacidiphila acidipaludis]|uniref:DUF2087 domain-containing protein n=1 Tax=Actinacidiphila acidipaludis TaxID=2873382 RepID=A0ABS7QGA0_9ACTN|nr:DUF2087 domain-containing protein [Streptomyces acidipaludis]MBY8880799.1 DUF2087 domain-containing protein [Streptomyces acidipaludis]